MILLIGLAIMCFLGAMHYRKLYRGQQNGAELQGVVVSNNTFLGWRNQAGWKYYELIVEANGTTYKIRTDNTKAKKYKKDAEVTILVPEEDEMPVQTNVPESHCFPTAVIIKEDRKKVWHIWFLFFFSVLFAAMAVLTIVSEFTR